MNVLIACEESQVVCSAFRNKGHTAFSCDIQECSGGHPEWHIKGDVLPLLNGFCSFITMDSVKHYLSSKWDLIIAHPPCTFLTVTGNRWFNVDRYGEKAIQRIKDRDDSISFFMKFVHADCDKIAIENPIGCMNSRWKKPTQIVQPWMFGDNFSKSTCLWLKGLNPLVPLIKTEPELEWVYFFNRKNGTHKRMPKWYADAFKLPSNERAKFRSKTFPGIANAMSEQWG